MFFGAMIGGVTSFSALLLKDMIQQKIYPISVPVLVERANGGTVWDMSERGKILKGKDGFVCLELMKRKDKIKVPKFKFITIDTRGKPVYPVFNNSIGQYFPMKTQNNVSLASVEDKGARNWGIQIRKRYLTKYGPGDNFWLKYGPLIAQSATSILIILLILYVMPKFELISNQLGGASAMLADAMKLYKTGG